MRKDILALLVIIGLSGACLFYRLGEIPNLHGDEGASGVQAGWFLEQKEKDFFRMGWAEQPMLSFAFQAVFLRIFGDNVFGLRNASVFFGILSTIPFYLILRYFLGFSFRETIATTLLYSFSHWFLAMARLGINYIQIVPFELLALLFSFLGFKFKKSLFFFFAGLLSGIPVYLYHAGRLVPFLIFGSFFLLVGKKGWFSLLPLCLGLLIILLPFGQRYLQNPDQFFVRSKDVMILNKFPDAFHHYQTNSELKIIWYQFLQTIKVFFLGGDNSEQYGYQGAIIPWPFQPLFVLGFFLAAKIAYRQPIWRCLLLGFWLFLTLGNVLTIDPYPPFIPRLAGAIPFIFFFIGLALKEIASLKLIVALILIWIAINFKVYFFDYTQSLRAGWANYEPATEIGYYLSQLGEDWEAIFFGCWKHYPTQGNIGFLAPHFPVHGEIEFSEAIKWPKQKNSHFVFLFLPYEIAQLRDWWEGERKNIPKPVPEKLDWQEEIAVLEKTFPRGQLRQFYRRDDSELFSAYEIF